MNAMSHAAPATFLPVQPRMTRRTLAKQQTREKVLEAARRLFCERGYEAATIRDIASAAGMSTGAVFASFADKSQLFDEIVAHDCAAMLVPMEAAARAGVTVRDALLGLFSAAYQFEIRQLPLVRAGMAASWTRSEASNQLLRTALRPITRLIDEVLTQGVARGELSQQFELGVLAGVLWDLYLSCYRKAVFDGLDAAQLTAYLAGRLDLVLKGAAG